MIEVVELNKTFNAGSPDELVALCNVSLSIREHQFVTVIGTNGSGKSTLLNAMAGNLFPDSGIIKIAGEDVTRKPDYKRAGNIARVFQNPYSGTAPGMTIAENLLMAWFRGKKRYPVFSMSGKLKGFFRDQLASLDMQLENRMENIIETLSGGQRQAITLLMAVLQTPQVLLLDEHTAALDPKTATQVIRLTERFISENKITTLMVTHSMKQALEMGDRTIMMHHGKIIEDIEIKEKTKLTVEDLLAKFDDIRKREKLTPQLIATLKNQYI
ncbi:MAG: ATP-binding cassette domain-containing protein [Bacteroidales bacterium]|nr:ATP-binding cassette domain-containing protein [Bacteroidales bacterium]MDD4603397.1 ATP-binding cassette domain-containing protein [Bacteroidales bacterium]